MSSGKSKRDKKKKFSGKKLFIITLTLCIIIISAVTVYKLYFQNSPTTFSLKAAIVDQLSIHYLNTTFMEKATAFLENAGFEVSYFESEVINVAFYQELFKNNYGIIILRTHSALRYDAPLIDLFTSETYNDKSYSDYRQNGLVTKGEYFFEQGIYYFAVTPKFVESFGRFYKSIIIAMGCSTLNNTSLAQAFLNKGAKAFVGWTNIVLPNDTDYETAKFLQMFFEENETLEYSLSLTREHVYRDPNTGEVRRSRMDFYPPSERNLKISDLIAEAKNSLSTFSAISYSFTLIVNASFRTKEFNDYRAFPTSW